MLSASARVFLIRHGETDWTVGGKHTSATDVPLSKAGERDAETLKELVVGEGKLIDPKTVAKIYCSPRSSARRTVEILGLGVHNHQDFFNRETQSTSSTQLKDKSLDPNIQLTPWLKEWDYGEYEGKTLLDIHSLRTKQGMSEERAPWNIWTDGCPGGESPNRIAERVDELIAEIKSMIAGESASWPSGQLAGGRSRLAQDIVCVAHGHVLSALALRWVGAPVSQGVMRLIFEPGGVAVLGFEEDNLDQPAIVLGRRPGRSDRTL
ncbi:hypothetical protein N7474_001387 [Penicillium riverlandense]|uniref:uncharacterized protein n=1 Tax=Penicillium riverlandense TaxID=1903569 RepID=UPI002547F077|nr:uncharacterized protein N7474_001387 [Penicillium riverlandense]KAJ5833076.1 hypothetical protein N7474_001387 [Penicillium riverlandense]